MLVICLDPFPVAGPMADGNGVDFVRSDFSVEDEIGAFDAVCAVGRRLELFGEEGEFLGEAHHVRVAFHVFVEDEPSLAVERFEVALDARELVGFLSCVGADVEETVLFATLGEEREEDLLIEGVLECVVLDEVIDLDALRDVGIDFVEPVDELSGSGMVVAGVDDIEYAVEVAEESHCLTA